MHTRKVDLHCLEKNWLKQRQILNPIHATLKTRQSTAARCPGASLAIFVCCFIMRNKAVQSNAPQGHKPEKNFNQRL